MEIFKIPNFQERSGQKSDFDENGEISATFFRIRPLEVRSPDSIELQEPCLLQKL